MFASEAAGVFLANGIEVVLDKSIVSTPMVSLGVVEHEAFLGVVITASHNPPDYNGYKLKSSFGGPTAPHHIAEVEALVPDTVSIDNMDLTAAQKTGQLQYVDLEESYVQHVQKHFDLEVIKNAGFGIAYDAMYGAGQSAVKRLLPHASFLHCEFNPSFYGQAPEPIHRNLTELSEAMKANDHLHVGFANDGDADRIGMYDGEGNFVDSHHILLLLLYYLHEFKELKGKVIITFSVTDKMRQLAEMYGLEIQVTKIGFKYIAEIMTQEEVLVGGEESGGLAVTGHIPERDGIWIALLILEFMAKTGKTIRQLIDEVYEKVGPFSFDRNDLHLKEVLKEKIVERCKSGFYRAFGPFESY